MKTSERDDLLSRIDERTRNIYRLTEKQEEHLAELNNNMMKHAVQLSSNRTSIRWIVRLLVTAVVVGSGATGLIQWLG